MRIDVKPGTCGCGCGEKVSKDFARGHVLRLVKTLTEAHLRGESVILNGKQGTAGWAASSLLSGASLERFLKNTFIPTHPVGTEVRAKIGQWNHRAVVAAVDSSGQISEVRYVDKRGLMRTTDRFALLP